MSTLSNKHFARSLYKTRKHSAQEQQQLTQERQRADIAEERIKLLRDRLLAAAVTEERIGAFAKRCGCNIAMLGWGCNIARLPFMLK